jgi:hypothetical protein
MANHFHRCRQLLAMRNCRCLGHCPRFAAGQHRAPRIELEFTLGDDGRVYLHGLHDGAIAASDVMLRIDLAEASDTPSMLAMRNAQLKRVALFSRRCGPCLCIAALQPFALSTETRRALRKHEDLLSSLRSELVALLPTGEQEQVEIERIKPRTLVTIAAGTIAANVLYTICPRKHLRSSPRRTRCGSLWVLVRVLLTLLPPWCLAASFRAHLTVEAFSSASGPHHLPHWLRRPR